MSLWLIHDEQLSFVNDIIPKLKRCLTYKTLFKGPERDTSNAQSTERLHYLMF